MVSICSNSNIIRRLDKKVIMKILKAMWNFLWKSCVAVTITTSGVYLYSKILAIVIEQGISKESRLFFSIAYCGTIIGSVIWIYSKGINFKRLRKPRKADNDRD